MRNSITLSQDAWNIGNFSGDENPDFAFGPVPMPSGTGVAADLFGVGWAMSLASEHQEAAKTFVEFFTRADILQILLDAGSAYSPFEGGASGMPELAAA